MTNITVLAYEASDRSNIKLMMDTVEDDEATEAKIKSAMKRNWPKFAIARIFRRKK